jgi:hypothetical protein
MSAPDDLLSQLDEERVVVIARVDSEPLAQILVDKLISDGIPARYSGSSLVHTWPSSGVLRSSGYAIHVPAWSAQRASELIVEERAGHFLLEGGPSASARLSTRGLVLVCLLIASVIGAVAVYAFAT